MRLFDNILNSNACFMSNKKEVKKDHYSNNSNETNDNSYGKRQD